MLFLLSIAAAVVVVFLCWNLYRRQGVHRLEAFTEKRRAASRIVGRGEFVDGNRHLEVALALTDGTFFYENTDMEASLDLQWVQEIEYDVRLATGAAIPSGQVLRLRCHSQTFEFVLPDDVVAQWHVALPPRSSAGTALAPAVLGDLATGAARAL